MYVCMYAWYLDEHVRRNTQPAALIYSACTYMMYVHLASM